MKTRIAFLLFFLILSLPLLAQTKRALIIGVGDYPKDSGWEVIHGNKDVWYVMKYLKKSGYAKNDILSLINSEATYQGISDAFDTLAQKCNKGDIVYVHFSGHGAIVRDDDGDEKMADNDDPFDEAWIPYDCKRCAEDSLTLKNAFIDDIVAAKLTAIRESVGKEGEILVVVDACKAPGSTKGVQEADDMTIQNIGISPRSTMVESDYIYSMAAPEDTNVPKKRFKETPILIDENNDWYCIYACNKDGASYETSDGVGLLVQAIFNVLTNVSVNNAPLHFMNDISRRVINLVTEENNGKEKRITQIASFSKNCTQEILEKFFGKSK